jgi:hypothetical protein
MSDTPQSEDDPALEELRQLRDETDPGFLRRVSYSIRRRQFGAHVVDACLLGSAMALLQLVLFVGQALNQDRGKKG